MKQFPFPACFLACKLYNEKETKNANVEMR